MTFLLNQIPPLTSPVNLKKLLNDLNEIEWSSTDVDIKADKHMKVF